MATITPFIVEGNNNTALFTLKIYRGEGMILLAMNWKTPTPPNDFVGFSIEFKEPNSIKFYVIKNRIGFEGVDKKNDPNKFSSLRSPIQKFRWVHFPRNANKDGFFIYRVTPVFMNSLGELSYGVQQEASIVLKDETYPNQLNVTFTRGFISSQAFVDRFAELGKMSTLLPTSSKKDQIFQPTHPKAAEALEWMGFEARREIINLLDKAIAAPDAQVRVVAYDLSEAEVINKFIKLGNKLKIIIDNSPDHKEHGSGENQAHEKLKISAGELNVKRHHMDSLQHNKMIIVDSANIKAVVFGSTNFSWRGFFVQANNAIIVTDPTAVSVALKAFENYWKFDDAKDFGKTESALWNDLQLSNIDVKVAFSPHTDNNALLKTIAQDIENNTTSSLLYSLAFLYQTKGAIRDAIERITADNTKFVYGISDKEVKGVGVGVDVLKPDGNLAPVSPQQLTEKSLPLPFKAEPSGGGGIRLHHKFLVVDFNLPTARVYMGSYNFSDPADTANGENLLLIKDQRIATSYMIEAIRLFDHYHFRVNQIAAKSVKKTIFLAKPPQQGQNPWWHEAFTPTHVKFRDRLLFA